MKMQDKLILTVAKRHNNAWSYQVWDYDLFLELFDASFEELNQFHAEQFHTETIRNFVVHKDGAEYFDKDSGRYHCRYRAEGLNEPVLIERDPLWENNCVVAGNIEQFPEYDEAEDSWNTELGIQEV